MWGKGCNFFCAWTNEMPSYLPTYTSIHAGTAAMNEQSRRNFTAVLSSFWPFSLPSSPASIHYNSLVHRIILNLYYTAIYQESRLISIPRQADILNKHIRDKIRYLDESINLWPLYCNLVWSSHVTSNAPPFKGFLLDVNTNVSLP